MRTQWYVIAFMILAHPCAADSAQATNSNEEMPAEIRTDAQRIYPLGEKFDRRHIAETCKETGITRYRCYKSTYDRIVKEREPTVTGYVLLLSIGTVVLAEERQKIIDTGRSESETERDLQRNSLDTAELIIDTLERVAKKAHVSAVEKPIVANLRSTLTSRAESVLKQKPRGRTIASLGTVPSQMNDERREQLLERLSGLTSK